MFKACAMPYLRALSDEVILSHGLNIVGSGESAVEAKLRDMMNGLTNPTLAPYAKEGEVMLRVTAKAGTMAEAEEMTKPVIAQVHRILGDIVYGVDVLSLEQVVCRLLNEKNMTLSTAESCTGGLIAKRVTDLSGSSRVFPGGTVCYAAESKTKVLGVPAELIEKYGVISAETAAAMAEGVKALFRSSIAVATTGLAGPEGDGINPVGTVFVALAAERETFVTRLSSGRGRARVRTLAANCALDMIRRFLTGLPVCADYHRL
jgi:nicotinamide-nucleotide amidase